jgi:hypothetical protein
LKTFVIKVLPLLVALALLFVAVHQCSCYHGAPGPTTAGDPTLPPFPIKSSPCAGKIDPNCWPFASRNPFTADGGTQERP